VPEGWHEASSILGTHILEMICEPYRYLVLSVRCMWDDTHFICNEKQSLIVLKTLGTVIQNSVIQDLCTPAVLWFVLHMHCYNGLCCVTLCDLTMMDFVFQIWCLEERAACLYCTTIREEGLFGMSRQCVMHLLHRFLLLKSVRSLNIFFLPSCT